MKIKIYIYIFKIWIFYDLGCVFLMLSGLLLLPQVVPLILFSQTNSSSSFFHTIRIFFNVESCYFPSFSLSTWEIVTNISVYTIHISLHIINVVDFTTPFDQNVYLSWVSMGKDICFYYLCVFAKSCYMRAIYQGLKTERFHSLSLCLNLTLFLKSLLLYLFNILCLIFAYYYKVETAFLFN